MKLSYIITTFNRPAMLVKAVEYVARERCEASELIVVDDCSRPPVDMPAIAMEVFPAAHRLIRHHSNAGVIGARNTGIAAARGEYLVFLDDDDESFPNRTADLLAQIENSAFDFVAARCVMQSGPDEKIVPSNCGFLLTPEKALLYPSHINAVIWRRKMFAGTPGLDDRVPYLGEHITLILCLLHGGSGWLSEAVVARFGYVQDGLTHNSHQNNRLKNHLTGMYQILLEESETPAFRQLCEKVLKMLLREHILSFDDYLQHLQPIIRWYR